MAKLTFYPLNNADSCLVDLSDGKKILFDFGNQKDPKDPNDKRIDLAAALREDLKAADRDFFDVVAITHLDLDHVQGSSDFFWLDHAKRYQGEGRIKINELWVPAAVICEDRPDEDDARVMQAEARHRFKAGKGIRVFSEPRFLHEWCDKNDVSIEDRKHLITDAGEVVPGFTKDVNGVEFFAHCPFAHATDTAEEFDRNNDSIVVQATFLESGVETKLIMGSDVTWEMWAEIVKLTKKYKNDHRLEWDVFKLPHHCSYLSLGPDKGNPVEEEADHFASNLLMPKERFTKAGKRLPLGFDAVLALKDTFGTSITSTAIRYTQLDLAPCALLKWNPDGFAWKWFSPSTYAAGVRSTVRTLALVPRDSATGKALAGDAAPTKGFFQCGTSASAWFPGIRPGTPRDLVFIEQAIQLGEFGVLTLLHPEQRRY